MPTAAGELKRVLAEFNRQHGAELSMVATRTGAPIAHEGPRDFSAETFAGLAATLLNAAEALYAGLGRTAPTRVILESDRGTLVATGLSTSAMFVAVGARDEMLRGLDAAAADIRKALGVR